MTTTIDEISKTRLPEEIPFAGRAGQRKLAYADWREAPQSSIPQDRCKKLHDQAVSAQRETGRLRKLLKVAAKKSERLRSIDMSNARLLKELAEGRNAKAHSDNGNGEFFTTEQVYQFESADAFLTGVRSQLLDQVPADMVITVFVPADDGWTQFEYHEAVDLYEDMDLVDDYLLVLCRSHNRDMHSLYGNMQSAQQQKADRRAIHAQKDAERQRSTKVAMKTAPAAKSDKAAHTAATKNAQQVIKQLADAAAKAQAADDVAKESPLDEREFAADVDAVRLQAAQLSLGAAIGKCSWMNPASPTHTFSVVYVSPDNRGDCFWLDLARLLGDVPYLEPRMAVGRNEADLITPVVPYTVLNCTVDLTSCVYVRNPEVMRKKADPTKEPPVEVPLELPLMQKMSQTKMKSMVCDCYVEIRHYTLGFPDQPYRVENSVVTLNVSDILTHLSQKVVQGIDFQTDLAQVRSTLERTDDIVRTNKYDFTRTTYLHDVVHTALVTSMLGPTTVSSGQLQYQVIRRLLYDQIIRGRPAPAGIYLTGYDVPFTTLFPGLTPDTIHKFITATSGFVHIAREGTVSAAKDLKKELAHAMKSAADIVGLHGFFPRQSGEENIFTGLCKRLAGPLPTRSDEMRRTTGFLGLCLSEELLDCNLGKPLTGPQMIDEALKHCASKGWPLGSSDFNLFMTGFECGCGWSRDGPPLPGGRLSPRDFLMKMGLPTDEYQAKAFLKAETTPADALKGVRFIIAPPVALRGYTQAILMRACESYAIAMNDGAAKHGVKHQTVDQWTSQLCKLFEDREYFAETDFTSFESNIDAEMLHVEGTVLESIAPEEDKPFIRDWYLFLCRSRIRASNTLFTFFLDPMRKSGEYQTSSCNNICNLIFMSYICIPMILRARHLRPIRWDTDFEEADCKAWKEAFHEWFNECIWYFEGDDGLIHLARSLDMWDYKWVDDAIKFLGVRLKIKYQRIGSKLNFCGTTVLNFGDGTMAKVVDALEILANATTLFDAVRDDSALKISIISYGKVCSYMTLYHDVPIVSTFCEEAVKFYRTQSTVKTALKSIQDAATTLNCSVGAYLRTANALGDEDGSKSGVDVIVKMADDKEAMKNAKLLISQIEYFSKELDDEFIDLLFTSSGVKLFSFGLPPVERYVTGAAKAFRDRVRAALDFEVRTSDAESAFHNCRALGVGFVAACETKIKKAFSEAVAQGKTTVHIDIPEIRAFMRGQVGHDQTIEHCLDDARVVADCRAHALVNEHNAYSFVSAWKNCYKALPMGTIKAGATSGPLLALGLMWGGYLGLPVMAALAALVGLCSFFVLLPLNSMSVWKTIPKVVLLMTMAPILYAWFLIHQAVITFDATKRSIRGCFTRALLTTDKLNALVYHAFRGHMTFRTAWNVPKGFVWFHVSEKMPDRSLRHCATVACTPEDAENGLLGVFSTSSRFVLFQTFDPVPICSQTIEPMLALVAQQFPEIPFVSLESDSVHDWLVYRLGDSLVAG